MRGGGMAGMAKKKMMAKGGMAKKKMMAKGGMAKKKWRRRKCVAAVWQ